VLGKLCLMHGQNNALKHPLPCHADYFARARNTLRRFFMIRSAASICSSKAGS
jgi:hypothetical protein